MKVDSKGTDIYYEVHGEGIPLILVEGIGYASWMWLKQAELSKSIKIIIFDNRGVGLSGKPENPYTMEEMCSDIDAVADACGLDKFFLLGTSMGGMIAQEYVMRNPSRVSGLILVNTNIGAGSILPEERVLKILTTPSDPDDFEALSRRMSVAFSQSFLRESFEHFDSIMRVRFEDRKNSVMYLQQLNAVSTFSSGNRLQAVKTPSLIISAEDDNVVPHKNSEIISEKLLNSKLICFSNSGHLVNMERPGIFNSTVVEFIREVAENRFEPSREKVVV